MHVKEVEIPNGQLARAADYIEAQLGPEGIEQVGGKTWWQWRRDNKAFKAEWIEMRKDHDDRKKSTNLKGQRIMLYVHGGAYFFGSVDEHRYQMQRHARKLKARVLAPRYRLAPQFPFPCGLQDCLAAYLYLLEEKHDPSTIILAGDSAGGGMVMSVLVTLRDQGLPLPAGAILISPWVDLTHSFPSLGGDGKMDYIPAHGFLHKPSISWPPPNADDLLSLERSTQGFQKHENNSLQPTLSKKEGKEVEKAEQEERVRGFSVSNGADASLKPSTKTSDVFVSADGKYSIGPKSILSIQLDDGNRVEIKDQIQMYAANHLITHPLVSPVLQPSLGGLPPLLIQTGGGELLHDEQVYLAHKAAQPLAYLPPPSNHLSAEKIQAEAARYRPTNVQLQVWDDLCHVAPTLSFTRPAKHMYRSIAQFGAWALARAQKTSIEILDDDSISIVSSDSSSSSAASTVADNPSPDDIKLSMPQSAQHVGFESIKTKAENGTKVGRAGDALPSFHNHMIRQRIDRHGRIYELAHPKDLVALNIPTVEVGVPKHGPLSKWMKAQSHWNSKFAKEKIKVQKKRIQDMQKGFEGFEGELPPPTALAGRRARGMKAEKKNKKSWGMSLWSLWGSKHDEMTLDREEKADQAPDKEPTTTSVEPTDNATDPQNAGRTLKPVSRSRSRSHHSAVTDRGQATTTTASSLENMKTLSHLAPPIPGLADATQCAPERKASPLPSPRSELSSLDMASPITPGLFADGTSRPQSPPTLIPDTDGLSTRPTRGGIAYPFSLKVEGEGRDVNASTVTLQSVHVGTPMADTAAAAAAGDSEVVDEKAGDRAVIADAEVEEKERPGMERFVTAPLGEFGFGGEKEKEKGNETEKQGEIGARPGVERFETAQEDLSTLANGKA